MEDDIFNGEEEVVEVVRIMVLGEMMEGKEDVCVGEEEMMGSSLYNGRDK